MKVLIHNWLFFHLDYTKDPVWQIDLAYPLSYKMAAAVLSISSPVSNV